jgi:hypothetical protein
MIDCAEKKDYLTFSIGDVIYLPHYMDSKLYVSPGYPRLTKSVYTSAELLEAGAKAHMMHLWRRAEYGNKKAIAAT